MTRDIDATIEEHWDTNGEITADSDPQTEYEMWREYASRPDSDWEGDELTLEDFERYIRGQMPTRSDEEKLAIQYVLPGEDAATLLRACNGRMRIARHLAEMTLWGIRGSRVIAAAKAIFPEADAPQG